LRSEGDGLLQDLIALFVTETPARLTTLATSVRAGSRKEAERAAHTLKSSAATLGATALSTVAAAAETAARAGQLDQVARLLESLGAEADRAIAALSVESQQLEGSNLQA
jgi:HPt (histidine-containing phosphotransfer) domain-containing protein